MPVVTNTELSKKLKRIFDAGEARKAQLRKEQKTKKSASDGSDGGPHVDANAPLKGVLGKGDNYARRAYTYIKGLDGRGVYRNFSFPHLDHIRDQVRKLAEFPGGPAKNFNPTHNQVHPYQWQAHHMLPGSAFYYELDGKPVFSLQQLRLILQTDYNINHGHNLIMLPEENWACPVHTLVSHLGDHESYTTMIMTSLKVIADEVQKKIDQAAPHDDIKADLFSELKNIEERAWKIIVTISRAAIPLACTGVEFKDDILKWEMDGVKLDFPNLA